MIVLPTIEQIHRGHQLAVEIHGGSLGVIRSKGAALESALEAIANRIHYQPGESVPHLAGFLCCQIAIAHALVDGNKRAAFFAMHITLEANGHQLP